MGSWEQTDGELCTVGFLGETPDAAGTDHQEKLLRPKVRVKSSQQQQQQKVTEGEFEAEAKICLKARGREGVLENKFSCVVMEESELTGLCVLL